MKNLKYLKKVNDNHGSMLIAMYMVIAIFVGLGAVFMSRSNSTMLLSKTQIVTTSALHIAEAGVERTVHHLLKDYKAGSDEGRWLDDAIDEYVIDNGELSLGGYVDFPYADDDNDLGDGEYFVRIKYVADDQIVIESTGQINDATQTVEATLHVVNLSVWDNALFIGSGSEDGQAMDGKIRIHGSIHMLADNLDEGDVAYDMKGINNRVYNSYRNIKDSLKELVPELAKVNYNGEWVESLNATVKVKQGYVAVNGSAKIGFEDADGNDWKETMDGVYVGDGSYDGIQGNKAEESVYSDVIANYDMGDVMKMPSLSDPYKGYESYTDYYKSEAKEYVGDIEIKPDTIFDFGDGASEFGGINGGCVGATNCFKSNGDGTIEVHGQMYIDGDFTTEKKALNKKLTYTGRGTILATGNIDLGTHLLSEGERAFPATNAIGFMTPKKILMTRAKIDVAGAFYAEDRFEIKNQVEILGTLVSNFVTEDAGLLVKLYQVPSLADNMPLGMIGTEETTIAAFVVGWTKK